MEVSKITILWSTQGGRAKACARRTSRILRESTPSMASLIPYGYYGSSFDDYGPTEFFKLGKESPSDCHKKLVILFVSTTGDAEQCDSIRDTWKMILQKSVPVDQFENIEFAMFCLGDRAYGPSAFCAAGRKLAARLVQLSAKAFCNIGYGDDGTPNGGVFSDLDDWLQTVFLEKLLGERSSFSEKHNSAESWIEMPESPYCVKLNDDNDNEKYDARLKEWQMMQYSNSYNEFFASQCPATAYSYDDFRILESEETTTKDDPRHGNPLLGCIVSNNKITGEGWAQDTRHIKIHMSTRISDASPIHVGSSQKIPTDGISENKNTANSIESIENSKRARTPLPYMAGDVATIMPSNAKSTVDRFLSCLPRSIQSLADKPLDISTRITKATQYSSSFTRWPKKATLRGILTHCGDISSLPEREDLRALRFYCNPSHPAGEDQRKKLYSLSETADTALYGDYVLREKRNWGDILFDFDSIKYEKDEMKTMDQSPIFLRLTIEQLLMILPPILPRHFSIASAPTEMTGKNSDIKGYSLNNGNHGFNLELCAAVVKGITRYGRQYQGLCSSYLSCLQASDRLNIRAWIRPGSFRKLPLKMKVDNQFETPVMYIGAGTGIAPLRSLIREREAVRSISMTSNVNIERCANQPDNILVFGCRKASMDYYYRAEWEKLQECSHLRVLNAFSQDQKHKLYVQRVIRNADEGLLIAKHLLENNGCLYIAGGAKMARAVKEEIVEILGKVIPSGEKGGKIVIQKLQRAGKFSVEAWS